LTADASAIGKLYRPSLVYLQCQVHRVGHPISSGEVHRDSHLRVQGLPGVVVELVES